MLSRFIAWLLGRAPQPPDPVLVDPLALEVARRQRAVAKRIARHTNLTPKQLLDYKRADGILGKRR